VPCETAPKKLVFRFSTIFLFQLWPWWASLNGHSVLSPLPTQLETEMSAINQGVTRLVSNRRLQPTVTISDYDSEMFCVRYLGISRIRFKE